MSFLTQISTSKHAPLVAAGFGIAGVIGVAVSASRDTLKAKRKMDAERDSIDFAINQIKRRAAEIKGASASQRSNVDPQEAFNLKSASYELLEKVKYVVPLVWKCYIPTVAISAATIGAVFLSWKMGSAQLKVAKMATYMAEQTFQTYSKNVMKRLEEGTLTKETLAEEESESKGMVKANKEFSGIVINGDQVPVLDTYSGRTFQSSMTAIREAANSVNETIFGHLYGYASLTDFYDHLNLEPTGVSDEVGWNADHPLRITFGATLLENGSPALQLDYELDPFSGYADHR